jgi:hypothetical protein
MDICNGVPNLGFISDLGYYECVSSAARTYLSTQTELKGSLRQNVESLTKVLANCDSRLDKQKFLSQSSNASFIMPKKFEPRLDDDSPELTATGFIREELEQRMTQLSRRLESLKIEAEECWKTLEAAEGKLLQIINSDEERSERIEVDQFHLKAGSTSYSPHPLDLHSPLTSLPLEVPRLHARHEPPRPSPGEVRPHPADAGGGEPELELRVSSQREHAEVASEADRRRHLDPSSLRRESRGVH